MQINGMAHVIVTVSDLARSRSFYLQLLPFLGLQAVRDDAEMYYCVGGRTAFGVRACDPQSMNFVPGKGLLANAEPRVVGT